MVLVHDSRWCSMFDLNVDGRNFPVSLFFDLLTHYWDFLISLEIQILTLVGIRILNADTLHYLLKIGNEDTKDYLSTYSLQQSKRYFVFVILSSRRRYRLAISLIIAFIPTNLIRYQYKIVEEYLKGRFREQSGLPASNIWASGFNVRRTSTFLPIKY